jgi:hypothetical protein
VKARNGFNVIVIPSFHLDILKKYKLKEVIRKGSNKFGRKDVYTSLLASYVHTPQKDIA